MTCDRLSHTRASELPIRAPYRAHVIPRKKLIGGPNRLVGLPPRAAETTAGRERLCQCSSGKQLSLHFKVNLRNALRRRENHLTVVFVREARVD
jgi:hypothetical protein